MWRIKCNKNLLVASQISQPSALPAYSFYLMPSVANGMHSPKKKTIPKAANLEHKRLRKLVPVLTDAVIGSAVARSSTSYSYSNC